MTVPALGRRSRGGLEERLQELEHGPLERLVALVDLAVAELRAARRRLDEQAGEMAALRRSLAELAERVERLEASAPAPVPAPAPADGHVLMLATPSGYRLLERAGAPPARGESFAVDGVRYRALGASASPLPGDARRCVLAQRA